MLKCGIYRWASLFGFFAYDLRCEHERLTWLADKTTSSPTAKVQMQPDQNCTQLKVQDALDTLMAKAKRTASFDSYAECQLAEDGRKTRLSTIPTSMPSEHTPDQIRRAAAFPRVALTCHLYSFTARAMGQCAFLLVLETRRRREWRRYCATHC